MTCETLQQLKCCKCATTFAVTPQLYQTRLRDKANFYCPLGHAQHFTVNEEDRLRAKLARAQMEAANALKLAKSEATRRRNLQAAIDAGVCPRCKRHFKNVSRHMAGVHHVEQ